MNQNMSQDGVEPSSVHHGWRRRRKREILAIVETEREGQFVKSAAICTINPQHRRFKKTNSSYSGQLTPTTEVNSSRVRTEINAWLDTHLTSAG
jgi:hypothetical protein